MAVSDIERRSDIYLGNGVTTEFAYPFKIFAASDLEVRQIDADDVTTVLVLDTDYTVSGVEAANGGVVTLTTPVPTGERLLIIGAQPFDQPLVLVNQGPYFATDVMRALDRCVILAQQLSERLGRAVVLPPQAEVADLDALIEGILALEGIAAQIATVAASIANVNTVGGNIADVNTVAASNTAITNLAAIDAALTNLDAIRTQILAVEANVNDVVIVASINAAVSVVAGIEAAVVAVAAIAANVTAVANIDAAVTRVAQKYQGAAAADPTVRALDGSALEVGDFYLNTVTDDIRFVTSVGPVVWSELTTLIDASTLLAMGVTSSPTELNILDGITGIASQAEARAGTSNVVLMTPLRAEERVSRFAAGGGTLTDLNTSFENRLSMTFTPTTKTFFMVANVGIQHQSATATDVLAELRLFDSVLGTEIITINGGETATGVWGHAVRFGLSMSSESLVVGRSYTARLYLRKSGAVGPCLPRDLRMEGICV